MLFYFEYSKNVGCTGRPLILTEKMLRCFLDIFQSFEFGVALNTIHIKLQIYPTSVFFLRSALSRSCSVNISAGEISSNALDGVARTEEVNCVSVT